MDEHVTASTPQLVRRLNAKAVLATLRVSGPLRVTEVAAATGLSRPTADAVIEDLVRLKWVAPTPEDEPDNHRRARGRPARRYGFCADAVFVLAIDIGVHKALAAVADLRGEVVGEARLELGEDLGRNDRMSRVRRAAREALAAAGVRREQVGTVAVATSGIVDAANGRVTVCGSMPEWSGFDLRSALSRSFRCDILIDNDSNLGAIGERWRGVASDVDDVVYLSAGERLGAGVIVGGRLLRGRDGAAGEAGFIDFFGARPGSEGIGALVRRLGSEAVQRLAAENTRSGSEGKHQLLTLTAGDPTHVTTRTVFEAAGAGDPAAVEIVSESVEQVSITVATMAMVLNPQLVVLGGGVTAAGDAILAPLRRRVGELTHMTPRIELSALADRAAITGAVCLALDATENRFFDVQGS